MELHLVSFANTNEFTRNLATECPESVIHTICQTHFSPIDPESDCFVDQQYTKAYLRHLFVADELLAMQIASVHNLAFYLWLVKEARRQIIAGTFATWKEVMVKRVSTRL
jgi:queuine tRNA-ribosyltransferase